MNTKKSLKLNSQSIEKLIRIHKLRYIDIAKIFDVSHQRIHQILTGYASPASKPKPPASKPKPEIKLKNYSVKKRRILGLPTVKLKIEGGRNYVTELVRIRDKQTCQICQKKWKKGMRKFDVHHDDEKMDGHSRDKGIIKWNYENFNKLITYCHKCHMNLNITRQKMINGRC